MFYNRRAGFTLIELIVVITLMMLIVSLVGINIASVLPKEKLKSTVRDIASTMRYARSRAQIQHQKVVVLVNIDRGIIQVADRKKHLPADITLYIQTPDKERIQEGTYRIYFFPGFGCSGEQIVVRSKERGYAVILDPLTGSVEVERLT